MWLTFGFVVTESTTSAIIFVSLPVDRRKLFKACDKKLTQPSYFRSTSHDCKNISNRVPLNKIGFLNFKPNLFHDSS